MGVLLHDAHFISNHARFTKMEIGSRWSQAFTTVRPPPSQSVCLDRTKSGPHILIPSPMIRTRGLTHIHLIVRDMKRSVTFYRKVFGMKISFKIGSNMVFLNTPGSKDLITLHEDPESEQVAGESGGIAHFGFQRVRTDLETAISEVTKAGGRLLEQGEHAPGVPYAYVADPDGYVIEL
jgi:catechol 2,3-dioxygenase-like lactoylglutathione lyase family enzyme